jgi:hypothetical protein
MAAPALAAATRYTSRGTSRTYWVATISNITAPTLTELNAGTDITAHILDLSGWTFSAEQIQVPDMATRVTATIPGPITLDDSSLTMYASKNGTDGGTLMPMDAIGNIVFFPGGTTAAYKMNVWPVTVASVALQMSATGSDANSLVITYSPSALPAINVAVPSGL